MILKELNIGIDIDGVLRALFPYGIYSYCDHYPLEKNKIKDWNEIKGWEVDNFFYTKNEDDINKFCINVFGDTLLSSHIFTDAPMYDINKNFNNLSYDLKNFIHTKFPTINCNIILCTTQPTITNKISTINWLKNNNIDYDDIIFTQHKYKFNLHYLVDDKFKNILDFNESNYFNNGYLYEQPYNSHLEYKNKINSIEQYFNKIKETFYEGML